MRHRHVYYHNLRRPVPRAFTAMLFVFTVIAIIAAVVSPTLFPRSTSAAGERAVVKMPFDGGWAWSGPNLVQPPYTDYNSSHPGVHAKYYGDWGTDIYAGAGTAVKLDVAANGPITFTKNRDSDTCSSAGANKAGRGIVLNVIVSGVTVGTIDYEHLDNISPGPYTNGMTLGTVTSEALAGSCYSVRHAHVEMKNATVGTYSCFLDHGAPGVNLTAGTVLGALASPNTGDRQACSASSVDVGSGSADDFAMAYRTNTGSLSTFDSNGAQSYTLGVASGTSPSVTTLSDGTYQTAFQANTGNLYVHNSASGAVDLGQGLAAGTSPAIAAFPGGGWQIAFQANNGNLYLYNSTNGAQSTTLGMKTGTNPSIAVLSNNAFQVAFQVNTGALYVYNNNSGAGSLNQGVAPGTSPAITALNSNAWQVAFQANTGSLFVYNWPNNTTTTLGLGMAAGTSPAITTLSAASYQVAFQANTGNLYVYNNSSGAANLNLGMQSGTSPSIAALDSGSWRAVIQANTGELYDYRFNMSGTGATNRQQGMATATSPSIDY